MKKQVQNLILALTLLLGIQANAQFTSADVQFWVGSGTDTSLLVVDFQDGTRDSSYAWGFLHDGNATGADMLNAVAAADVNFSVDMGSFLNGITYGTHVGVGGTDDFFWGTWSGNSIDSLTLNTGISEMLTNGAWFGCSFTDFDPAIAPGEPIAAFDPVGFTIQDIDFFVGTGTDTSILVVDFLTSSGISSYAWGYIYSGTTTGEQMLNDIAAADPNLSVTIAGGFLNGINYGGLEGVGGSPNFWGTWSATNLGNWDLNTGIGETLENGDLFGCSYTDFNPALRPGVPTAASTNAFFTLADVQYWVGSGSDSSLLVVDFNDGGNAYAWGFLHDGTATGADMLNAVAAADVNFSVNLNSFLNDITYGAQEGIGGTDGFFWGTWSGTGLLNLGLNTGIGEVLSNGAWFGCSFTDFNPALAPSNPIAAFEPFGLNTLDIDFFVGTGTDTSVLVVDFLTPSGVSSYAWGYVYSGTSTGEQMLNDIAAADPNLSVTIASGFLNGISYGGLEGIGGNPNFWGTWSGTNLGNWALNIGIGETLENGDLFGCSYTDFNPALRPGVPTAASTDAFFTLADVQYWVGSGSDSSLLVVDFNDGGNTYAWGFLHDGTATGADMLNAVAAADVNFSVNLNSFLNDITYGDQAGIGGTNGFFWGTWSGTGLLNLGLNTGIGEVLSNGDWFGCSFTDFNPALAPSNPIAAFEPLRFTTQDVDFFVGEGMDTSVLVVDFLTPSGVSSYAWGYLYTGTTTGEQMLNDIAAADPNLSVTIGSGFLNGITYDTLAGVGGSPNFWGTWSATNLGNWSLNTGIGETLQNGDLFGCSYTDFNPALRPGYPVAASMVTSVRKETLSTIAIEIYPNPTTEWINLDMKAFYSANNQVRVLDLQGRVVWQANDLPQITSIPVHQLPSGVYNLMISDGTVFNSKRFIKQ